MASGAEKPGRRGRAGPGAEETMPASQWTLARVREEYMVAVVHQAGGGREAARILGIDRRALRAGLERRLAGGAGRPAAGASTLHLVNTQ